MSAARPAHELIAELVTLVQGFLPDGYVLGYELIHTDVSDEERIRADHEIKRRWRERLARENRPGASDDADVLPADASTVAETHVLFEILHIPTGTQAVRTVPMDDLMTAANAWQSASTNQKKTIEKQVQNYLKGFYALCETRVAGGG